MRGTVTAHELGAIAQRHFTTRSLGRAGADVIDAYVLRFGDYDTEGLRIPPTPYDPAFAFGHPSA
ncbi:hypothetical protein [Streptomyces syringium]|uniref:hypothetical protein n=1 Tax=Streptomyces syringium TaxID=76729 RepID=UPI0034531EB8